jgi:hypothetical protein
VSCKFPDFHCWDTFMKHSCMVIGLSPNRVQGMRKRVFFFSYWSVLSYMAVGLKIIHLIPFTTYSIKETFWLRLCYLKPFHNIKCNYNCILMYVYRLRTQTSGYSVIQVTQQYKILDLRTHIITCVWRINIKSDIRGEEFHIN